MTTKTKIVWLLEGLSYHSGWKELERLWLDEGLIEVLASDYSLEECYSLVAGNYNDLNLTGLKIMIPKAGIHVDCGGAEVFVDDNQQVVDTAEEVVESLDLEDEDIAAYRNGTVSAYQLLEMLQMVF